MRGVAGANFLDVCSTNEEARFQYFMLKALGIEVKIQTLSKRVVG
jgi:hypothetical protein